MSGTEERLLDLRLEDEKSREVEKELPEAFLAKRFSGNWDVVEVDAAESRGCCRSRIDEGLGGIVADSGDLDSASVF